jgi:hypothetical protein
MIIKERIKLVLVSAHFIVGAYLLMYLFIPGYMKPFFNDPCGRLTVLLCIVLFIMNSGFYLFLPEPEAIWKKYVIAVYWRITVGANIFLALFGPAAMSLI